MPGPEFPTGTTRILRSWHYQHLPLAAAPDGCVMAAAGEYPAREGVRRGRGGGERERESGGEEWRERERKRERERERERERG